MSERHKRKNARKMLTGAGYKSGGHLASEKKMIGEAIREHDDQQHGGKKTRLRLRDGGCADGGMPKARADRKGRGMKGGKAHTTVNVVVAGHPGGGGGQPVPVPVPKPIPVPVNAGAGGPPMPPGGGGMPGAGPMPPPGLKRGGRAKAPKIDSQRDTKGGMPAGHFKNGGKTKGKFPVPMEEGAGGGLGRIQKAKDYGART